MSILDFIINLNKKNFCFSENYKWLEQKIHVYNVYDPHGTEHVKNRLCVKDTEKLQRIITICN